MFSTVGRSITFLEHTVISDLIELAVLVLCNMANAVSNCYSFRKGENSGKNRDIDVRVHRQ